MTRENATCVARRGIAKIFKIRPTFAKSAGHNLESTRMRKQPEVEDGLKSLIRDELALNPLVSVQKMRIKLFLNHYRTENGMLDWHYISKLMMKVRRENLQALNPETRLQRLAAMKERHRVLTDILGDIAAGKQLIGFHDPIVPTQADRIAAANTIMKWDLAMFYAEESIKQSIEKPEPVAVIVRRSEESKTKKWARIIPKILSS